MEPVQWCVRKLTKKEIKRLNVTTKQYSKGTKGKEAVDSMLIGNTKTEITVTQNCPKIGSV